MIRTNLSTRPFYDTRAVALWLAVAALLVAGATLFNVGRVLQYTRSDSVLGRQATQDAEQAASLRAEAARLRGSVDSRQVARVSTEARLANDLIDRRVFSWTALFNLFEETLPPGVRVTSVRPLVDRDGRIQLTITVVARAVDDVNQFMESLETTGAFRGLLTRQEVVNDADQIEASLEAFYEPQAGRPASTKEGSGSPTTPSPATAAPSSSAPLEGPR
ncbi:MAG: PilN domain-containing protein [Acidimicrobiia bacterium]|nr:PilN domain-containing protein [Acidimicrobiia bacterium]